MTNLNGEISKKIQYFSDGAIVEEEVNDEVQAYVDYEINWILGSNKSNNKLNNKKNSHSDYLGRSDLEVHKYCTKNLQEYFRRSVNFNNNFLSLSQIY